MKINYLEYRTFDKNYLYVMYSGKLLKAFKINKKDISDSIFVFSFNELDEKTINEFKNIGFDVFSDYLKLNIIVNVINIKEHKLAINSNIKNMFIYRQISNRLESICYEIEDSGLLSDGFDILAHSSSSETSEISIICDHCSKIVYMSLNLLNGTVTEIENGVKCLENWI